MRPEPLRYRLPLGLFVLTVLSIVFVGATFEHPPKELYQHPLTLLYGLPYAAALLAILLVHEFGHYIAARLHGVRASLPFFIPMPVSMFGTLGAVIVMRDRIRSRSALVDIGASGPIAGLVVAIPVLLWGLAHSPLVPISPQGSLEGQCLLYLVLKRIALGPIPDGYDVQLGPVAFAGWVGLVVTMLNLWPVGQLDGGHVAYALFGPRYARVSRLVRLSVLVLALCNLGGYYFALGRTLEAFGLGVGTSIVWFMWFAVLSIMRRLGGEEHPPTEPGELSLGRRIVACTALALFALLLMPTVWVQYG